MGWGSDADTLDNAIRNAAHRIVNTRDGISQEGACKIMHEYLESGMKEPG